MAFFLAMSFSKLEINSFTSLNAVAIAFCSVSGAIGMAILSIWCVPTFAWFPVPPLEDSKKLPREAEHSKLKEDKAVVNFAA